MKKSKHIRLKVNAVQSIIRDLNTLVVSLDRIGSAYSHDQRRLAFEQGEFLRKSGAFKKLAQMRKALLEACDAQCSTTEVERFEQEMQKQRIWRSSNERRPQP